MNIIVIGIDVAESIFAVHGVNKAGKAEWVKPRVSPEQLWPLIAQIPLADRHGSLLWRPPLGTFVPITRPQS